MELTQLRTFAAVADLASFTRAAERLHVTQSAVSQQIRALEEELGETLLHRAGRAVRVSPAGEAALEHARRILAEAEALRGRFQGAEGGPSGRVRAAAATQAFVHLFAPLFESFMERHPHVDLSFRTTPSTDRTIEEIREGTADVGFASLPVYAPGLEIAEMFEDELVLVVGRAHPFATRKEVSPTALARERFVLFERGASIRRATDRFFQEADLAPALALESNDADFIQLMVAHGVGLSLLPAWAVRAQVGHGRVAALRIRGHRLRRTVALVISERRPTAAARAFRDFILERRAFLQARAAATPASARGGRPRRPSGG